MFAFIPTKKESTLIVKNKKERKDQHFSLQNDQSAWIPESFNLLLYMIKLINPTW